MPRPPCLGKAQEDQAEDGPRILAGLKSGVRAELVGGGPEAFFERLVGGVPALARHLGR